MDGIDKLLTARLPQRQQLTVLHRPPQPFGLRWFFFIFLLALGSFFLSTPGKAVAQDAPLPPAQTVRFPSSDGKTTLTGYLYTPFGAGPHPAVVLLHGRAGLYSSRVNASCTQIGPAIPSPCDADTLTARHRAWAAYWIARGYVVLLVDSFGPRGVARGFGRYTHGEPERAAVNELTVRPLDAEGALQWLAARSEVDVRRIMLQGWSNGASTALNVMQRQATRPAGEGPSFAAALVFYPGCGRQALLSSHPEIDKPMQVLLGSADEEVSPVTCQRVLRQAIRIREAPAPVVTLYAGATHDFDDPGRARQAVEANRIARADALARLGPWLDQLAP
ncbi:dienelactone hydrolase family protein [Herbaspirillum sp. DW155]|uniref:dienelactone hydrolase family protein n=1 Tax=Herbaspirillum sp. DW155 TaxID=3095609 RepID=UPI00308D655F|nr:dienelactone hydrolase family protein [Herbaspirillum sp. DW155]